MKTRFTMLLCASLALLIAGCSTQQIIDQRIAKNQELFNTYPTEVQDKIRSGQIDIGFTREMVRLAWGEPDQMHKRTTKAGISTVWTYTRGRSLMERERMTVPVTYIDASGRRLVRYRSVWIDWENYREYTIARVEFMEGRVTAIEQLDED
jgi:hypothetical protein